LVCRQFCRWPLSGLWELVPITFALTGSEVSDFIREDMDRRYGFTLLPNKRNRLI
jgi:hypothetical protein